MTELPYRIDARRLVGTKQQKRLPEYRWALTEADAHVEARKWLEELKVADPGVPYDIGIAVLRTRKRKPRPVKPKTFVAYHEAGHVVAAWHYNYPIAGASMMPGVCFQGDRKVVLG